MYRSASLVVPAGLSCLVVFVWFVCNQAISRCYTDQHSYSHT